MLTGIGGELAAAPAIHVTGDPATAREVRAELARVLATNDGALDVAVREATVVDGARAEHRVELAVTISDSAGRIVGFARSTASASGAPRRLERLRLAAARDAAEAAAARVDQR